MSITDAIQKLTILGVALELLYRGIVAIINMLRMLLSKDYRDEIFNNDLPPLETAA